MKFIDAHCHLDGGHYADLSSVLKRARAVGVEKIITAGCDLKSSELCKNISEEYDFVYFTAGYHPTELNKYREGDLEKIAKLCMHKKCVALGEIGLDYHYEDTDKPKQKKFFEEQLKLAHELHLPVQIHSRDSAADTLAILKERAGIITDGALMHCFSYSTEIASEFSKLGVYFSFGGTSTYKSGKKARRTIRALSDDRLITETDSPYLSPESKRGVFPNTPESIPEIAETMADARGCGVAEITERIWENAHRLFSKL